MYKEDITGSIAHAAMLGKQGVISEEDSALLQKTLKGLLEDIENGKVEFDEKAEDIHMNICLLYTSSMTTPFFPPEKFSRHAVICN